VATQAQDMRQVRDLHEARQGAPGGGAQGSGRGTAAPARKAGPGKSTNRSPRRGGKASGKRPLAGQPAQARRKPGVSRLLDAKRLIRAHMRPAYVAQVMGINKHRAYRLWNEIHDGKAPPRGYPILINDQTILSWSLARQSMSIWALIEYITLERLPETDRLLGAWQNTNDRGAAFGYGELTLDVLWQLVQAYRDGIVVLGRCRSCSAPWIVAWAQRRHVVCDCCTTKLMR